MLYEDPLAAAVQINSTVVPVRPWATTTAGGGGESACARPACISTPAQGEATKTRTAMRRRAITADLTLASGTQTRMGHESHPYGRKSPRDFVREASAAVDSTTYLRGRTG